MRLGTRAMGWCAVLVVLSVATAIAHLRVDKTTPEANAVLADAPQHIQVWFTQSPDPAISLLTLEGPDGAIELGDTMIHEDKSLMAMLPSALDHGSYTVKWRTAGNDGHALRGDFAFTVRAAD